jgi:hydroxyethylthiazole kinase-like uncharacterized protein yjeF
MIELLTPDEMAMADRLAVAAGISGATLMERAGRAVADVVARRPLGTRVLVLCGTGNNGGDGFVAARILAERGYSVRLALAGAREVIKGDAATAAGRWRGPVENAFAASLDGVDLIIDALIGAGLQRDLGGDLAAMVERIGACGHPVVAVDLPSGIDGASGAVRGIAVRASETVTFHRRKPGHLLVPGRFYCGSVRIADIGIPDFALAQIAPLTSANAPALWLRAFPRLDPAAHKYARGHVTVLSGGIEATGAARLAARAALRTGAGLVTVASPSSALLVHAVALEAVMVRRCDGAPGLRTLLEDRRRNALVLGPGLKPDEAARDVVETALSAGRAALLDAGALTAFAGAKSRLAQAIAAATGPVVITPHEGEFARLVPHLADTARSKLDRARAGAEELGAIVLLKGPDSVIAHPDGRAAICENAPATLATAGAGDVLAGVVAGLMAQAMPAFEAAAAGAWLHGEAARSFGGRGLIAEDLPNLLPPILKEIDSA